MPDAGASFWLTVALLLANILVSIGIHIASEKHRESRIKWLEDNTVQVKVFAEVVARLEADDRRQSGSHERLRADVERLEAHVNRGRAT